ncbi:nuclear transport factor 2 family protein [Streptomyces sp. NBC_00557]|uniref:nuclear transport factor 2 family protein n=1 Tax=Streptomyces sp. NBC_00557 TaxID=2975776 RepID=UPI002E804E19|nr:nuclear transport factor 2 family protein [Streptomyces sp. NBC_00557]WUC39193.1 nuclear transport factor 2 family protein [Streptomyces sp. NBC_00557]
MSLTSLDHPPGVVRAYLDACTRDDRRAAAECFTESAVVVDDGSTYRGREAISRWIGRSSTEYTYTSTPTAAVRRDGTHWNVTQRVEGGFPGGVVDLDYAFTLDDAGITELVINPV